MITIARHDSPKQQRLCLPRRPHPQAVPKLGKNIRGVGAKSMGIGRQLVTAQRDAQIALHALGRTATTISQVDTSRSIHENDHMHRRRTSSHSPASPQDAGPRFHNLWPGAMGCPLGASDFRFIRDRHFKMGTSVTADARWRPETTC